VKRKNTGGLSLGFCLCLFLSDLRAFAVSFDGLFKNGGTVPGFCFCLSDLRAFAVSFDGLFKNAGRSPGFV